LTISIKPKKRVEGVEEEKYQDENEEILPLTIFGISCPATDKRRKIFRN